MRWLGLRATHSPLPRSQAPAPREAAPASPKRPPAWMARTQVYKGLWRGMRVAVKTLVLPANMSGAEKREKMVRFLFGLGTCIPCAALGAAVLQALPSCVGVGAAHAGHHGGGNQQQPQPPLHRPGVWGGRGWGKGFASVGTSQQQPQPPLHRPGERAPLPHGQPHCSTLFNSTKCAAGATHQAA